MNIVSLRYYPFLFAAILSIASCYSNASDSAEEKNEVTIRLRSDPKGLNIFLASTGYAIEIGNNIFSPLMVFDPTTLKLVPYLAEEGPTIQPILEGEYQGGIRFTYQILEEAHWDNGSPVLASDYVFTFKTLMNPKVPADIYRAYYSYLQDIQIDPDNPRKFTILTNATNAIAEYALGNIEVLPEYVYDPKGLMKNIPIKNLCQSIDLDAHLSDLEAYAEQFMSNQYAFEKDYISGAGPYRVEEMIPDQRVVLKQKENWWGNALSKERPILFTGPDRLIYKPILDETVSISLLKNQEIDAMSSISPAQFVEIQTDDDLKKNYNLHTPISTTFSFVAINNQHPLLKDKRVRRALAHIVDVDEIIKTSLYGLAQRMTSPVHPMQDYYHKDLQPIHFDLEAARQLLKEAGWKDSDDNGILDQVIDGKKVEMKLRYRNSIGSNTGTNTGLLLQQNARKAGIEIELINQEFHSLMEAYAQRDYELIFSSRRRDPMPDDFKQSWHTSSDTPSGGNRIGFGNSVSDALIDEIQATLDEKKRNLLYRKFQQLTYDEQACIFLFAPQERIAIHKRFQANPSLVKPGFLPRYFKKASN